MQIPFQKKKEQNAMTKQLNIRYGVVYCRYSSDTQRGESIHAQLRVIRDYAERNSIAIGAEYITILSN